MGFVACVAGSCFVVVFWHMLQNPCWGDSIACLPGLVFLFCVGLRPADVAGAALSLAAPDFCTVCEDILLFSSSDSSDLA